MNYMVIEYTPGYLSEDDDPPVFDQYAEALNYLNELHDDLWNEEWAYSYPPEHLEDKYPPVFELEVHDVVEGSFVYYDNRKTHDLGRIVEIVPVEPE